MFNSTRLIVDRFTERLHENYRRTYGSQKPHFPEIAVWAGRMALEQIATSDALYHNVEHTVCVTLVGQEILHGRHCLEGGVTPEDWLHFTIAALCHDIGYVKGICRLDNDAERLYASGVGDRCIALPTSATDASLTPYHVDR
ncbi:MAG TPA: metal-dependent phosphohydrolase, partial [Oscillatoriales cyanobacterium M59_W2019_021]|nr:metal-dependent phosphohydrolase [Oscillatoriales cyanobacterium M59_W2019_021]